METNERVLCVSCTPTYFSLIRTCRNDTLCTRCLTLLLDPLQTLLLDPLQSRTVFQDLFGLHRPHQSDDMTDTSAFSPSLLQMMCGLADLNKVITEIDTDSSVDLNLEELCQSMRTADFNV